VKKSITTEGNFFRGERNHLHIAWRGCTAFQLTHSNEHIRCWDEKQVGRYKFELKNKPFSRKPRG